MRALSANLFAALLLCVLAAVFYVWSALESRLERHKRGILTPGGEPLFGHGLPVDLSAKTFRALLAVPPRLGSRPQAYNLTDEPAENGDKRGSEQRGEAPGSPVDSGMYWSEWLEEVYHVGFTEDYAHMWQQSARTCRLVRLEPGCGRVSNQLATFADGTKACVRYGINADQVQGETLTYYLARLLGITNLPPLVLSQLSSEQWASVRTRIAGLQWSDGAVVSLTEWISNLTGVVTPAPLRQESTGLHPQLQELHTMSRVELLELMQWTDLIVLDYLTANFDRLVSNLFSLQWDAHVMERDANNLLKSPRGDLVFIDNEAGLVHGFRVLDMWEKYHSTVLESVCVFRRRTAQRVAELHRRRDCRQKLMELYRDSEPLSRALGFLSDEHAAVLQDRVETLYKHMLHCKGKYSRL
ncbi:four-jointed box protein 1 [Gouania willdenowi]|uniref:Four-jointed box kinase 1 n=1 Tax=Gouania willdenowi TaxID=441366 RepID=A0A8C5EDQ4_GOUWI|nr:four-jointed box protein 1 [Gouania willdenowi]